jgi:truncated hemoglobin YjbI
MQISQTLVRQTILILLACAVVLSGCSRMNLAYRNLDLLIPWSLNDYLDMNRDQQTRFREQLREHISWHCRTQLPGYLDLIEQLQAQVRQGSLDEPALREHYETVQRAIQTIALEITPTTVQLLRDLDDRQVEELDEQFERDRQEREDKYLKPPLDQQIDKRTDRMQERVEQWLGKVTAAQRQRIHEWAEALNEQNQLWLDNRAQWQRSMVDAVRNRDQANFDERIARLLQDREVYWTAPYRAAFPTVEQATIDLIVDLYETADATQRRHIDQRLQDMRRDLGSLDCLPATAD